MICSVLSLDVLGFGPASIRLDDEFGNVLVIKADIIGVVVLGKGKSTTWPAFGPVSVENKQAEAVRPLVEQWCEAVNETY